MAWIPAAIGAGAGLLQGLFGGNQAKKDRAEAKRQFDLQYGLQKSDQQFNQGQVRREQALQHAMAPGRQHLLQQLYQRMGINAPAAMGGFTQPAAAPPPTASVAGGGGVPNASPGGFGSALQAGSDERIQQLMRMLGVGGAR